MVLHREHRLARVTEALDGAVVEIQMRHLDVGGQRSGIDGKAVILRRDFDLARAELLDRMVRAAVTELQLERLAADGKAQNLVAKTDSERRNVGLHHFADA